MEKDKKKNQNKAEETKPEAGDKGTSPDQDQTMVALTYDEYEAIEQELDSLKAEVEAQKDGRLRTLADFDNYKKRIQRDAERTHQDSITSILKVFLQAVDDMERALQNEPTENNLQGWVDGVALIHQKILSQIKNYGVERLDVHPGDEFDPNIHEAISQEEHPDFEEGQIIDILQPGYRIIDRIIRPAMVRVAR